MRIEPAKSSRSMPKRCVDTGSYSAYPFTAAIEASQVSAILPGPYDIPVYRCVTSAVATNKAPQLPYRGVARPGCCYAMELMVDAIAREIGSEPHEVRTVNLVRPEQMPYDNVTDKHFDSGDYPQLLRMAVEAIDASGVRARQRRDESDGRLIGLGMSIFSEQTGHGMTADGKRRVLYEQTFARHHSRRPARDPSRHSEHRPGIRDHAGANRQRNPRPRSRGYPGQARRYRDLALLQRRLGLARHDLGRRSDVASLQGIGRTGRADRRGAAANRQGFW